MAKIIITRDDIQMARTEQTIIHEATGNDYSVIDILCALDCAVTHKGISERLIIKNPKAIGFQSKLNAFMVRKDKDFQTVQMSVIRDMIRDVVTSLPKEIRTINDAAKGNVISEDAAVPAKAKRIGYADHLTDGVMNQIVTELKALLT